MSTVILTIVLLLTAFQDLEPKPLQKVEPPYPSLARAARVRGDVKMAVTVNPDGSVKDVKIAEGHPLLNEAAVEAIRQWKFSATPSGGTVNVTLPFTLADPPTGSITGRVVDSDGRPLSDMIIGLTRLVYRSGKRAWSPILLGTRTDERGEYKLTAEPGEYYVTATYAAVNKDQSDAARSQTVFFPGTTDPGAGVPVRVAVNSPAAADLRLPRVEDTRGVRISGKILIPLLDQPPRGPLDVRLQRITPQYAPDAVAGQFPELGNRSEIPLELRNVQPGSYLLSVTLVTGPPNWGYSTQFPIEVRNRDIEGLTVPIHRNIEFKGRVISQDPAVRMETLRLIVGGVFPVAADGTVRLFNIPEGTHNVSISGGLGNAYVRDMRLGPSNIYNDGEISVKDQPLPDLEIVLGANGGSIQGTVEATARVPVTNAYVALVPDSGQRQNPLFFKNGRSNSSSAFRFAGIAPGEYKLFAFEVTPPEGATESAEFMAQYQQRGVRVTIREGTALQGLAVPVIPKS